MKITSRHRLVGSRVWLEPGEEVTELHREEDGHVTVQKASGEEGSVPMSCVRSPDADISTDKKSKIKQIGTKVMPNVEETDFNPRKNRNDISKPRKGNSSLPSLFNKNKTSLEELDSLVSSDVSCEEVCRYFLLNRGLTTDTYNCRRHTNLWLRQGAGL